MLCFFKLITTKHTSKMSIKNVTKQSCDVNFSLNANYMNAPP